MEEIIENIKKAVDEDIIESLLTENGICNISVLLLLLKNEINMSFVKLNDTEHTNINYAIEIIEEKHWII